MRNLLLSAALIALPVTGFALVESTLLAPPPAAQKGAGLGDLSAFEVIVGDTQKIAQGGDLAAAEHRITDLETLWDETEPKLRPADPGAWGVVDAAADAAFSALRAEHPDPAQVQGALAALQQALVAPVPQRAGPVTQVAGIDVTDATGHPLPCEAMIGTLRAALGAAGPSAAVADLQAKALERCNADDDTRADAFAAEALAQLKG